MWCTVYAQTDEYACSIAFFFFFLVPKFILTLKNKVTFRV